MFSKNLFAIAIVVVFALASGVPAYANSMCRDGTISCEQPTPVKKGQKVPVWRVEYCVIGTPGHYKKIDCKSPRALHQTPIGKRGVCFIGTDNKPHYDYQKEVFVGRPFKNVYVSKWGRWAIDWQDSQPY